jgi:hypothetical protein
MQHICDFKFIGINLPVEGLEGRRVGGKHYACRCGARKAGGGEQRIHVGRRSRRAALRERVSGTRTRLRGATRRRRARERHRAEVLLYALRLGEFGRLGLAWRIPPVVGAEGTRTVSKAGGKWNEAATWVEGVVPTNADDVVDTTESGELIVEAEAVCRSLTLNYCKFKRAGTARMKIGGAAAGPENVAIKFGTSMTLTDTSTTQSTFEVVSTAGTQQTLDFGGHAFREFRCNGNGGSWKLASAVSVTGAFKVERGAFVSAGKTLTIGTQFTSGSTQTRTTNLDGSTLVIEGGGTEVWSTTTTGNTFSAVGTIVKITRNSGVKTISGGGLTALPTFRLENNTTGSYTIGPTASNTFQAIEFVNSKGVCKWGAGFTQTLVTAPTWTGKSGELITMESTTSGTAWTLKCTSGTAICDYLSLKDSHTTGGAEWFAGANSTNVSGNEGWAFTGAEAKPAVAAPSAASLIAYQLNAESVNPNGVATEAWFEWGPTTSYGTKTTVQSLGSGHGGVALTPVNVYGLELGHTYHFRVVAKNAKGEVASEDKTFTPTGQGALELIV